MDRTERYCLVLASETLPLEKKKETDILCQVVFIVLLLLLLFFPFFPHVISQQSEGKGPARSHTAKMWQSRHSHPGLMDSETTFFLTDSMFHLVIEQTCITLGPLLKLGFPS